VFSCFPYRAAFFVPHLSFFSLVCSGGEYQRLPLLRLPPGGGPILANDRQVRLSLGCKNDPLCEEGPCGAGGGVAKNFWVSMLEQTREKKLKLGYNKVVRHEKHGKHAGPWNEQTMSYKKEGRTGLWKHIPPDFLPPRRPPHRGIYENCGSSLVLCGEVCLFGQCTLNRVNDQVRC
jgi:hypothetical protein